jgi:hypothetical protein
MIRFSPAQEDSMSSFRSLVERERNLPGAGCLGGADLDEDIFIRLRDRCRDESEGDVGFEEGRWGAGSDGADWFAGER